MSGRQPLDPPGVADAAVAERFFAGLAALSPAAIACEPRHASWFTGEADDLLNRLKVARVAAQAKLNLGLRILARERGGYHEIETLFARLALADTVTVRAKRDAVQLRSGTIIVDARA